MTTQLTVKPDRLGEVSTRVAGCAEEFRVAGEHLRRVLASLDWSEQSRAAIDARVAAALGQGAGMAGKADGYARFLREAAESYRQVDRGSAERIVSSAAPYQDELQQRLAAAKEAWWHARVAGDQAGMDKAHREADLLRGMGARESDEVNRQINAKFESQRPTAPAGPAPAPAPDSGAGGAPPVPVDIDMAAVRAASSVAEKMAILKPVFVAAQEASGIPWQIKAAQWAIETGWGASTPHDINTGAESRNLYGIKWNGTGKYVESWTQEVHKDGSKHDEVAKFQVYDSYSDSITAHTKLLMGEPRYEASYACGSDLRCWCEQLQKSGYATDTQYGAKLWSIISYNKWNQ